jgi:predicted Zn-dependent protease
VGGRCPAEAAPALRLARSYIDVARRTGDPRFLGYAQAVIAQLSAIDQASTDAQVLTATILQSLHQFDAALRILDQLLAHQPLQAQALVTRATVLQLQGRFSEAQRDCAALWQAAGDVTAELCLAGVGAVTGRQQAATLLLQRVLAATRDDDHASQLWACTLLAEIAVRNGDTPAASRWFQAALRANPADRYLLASYSDFLLTQGGASEVLRLTDSEQRDDNLLLRRTLALQKLPAADATLRAAVRLLGERYAAAAQRGDRTHLREQARFALQLLHDAPQALRLARDNWEIQKEPADFAILIEAAAAARDDAVLREARLWQSHSGLSWPALQPRAAS